MNGEVGADIGLRSAMVTPQTLIIYFRSVYRLLWFSFFVLLSISFDCYSILCRGHDSSYRIYGGVGRLNSILSIVIYMV